LLLFGAAVLAVKLLWPAGWPHVLWGALGVVPVVASAAWSVGRRCYTPTETVALLDRRLSAGGLLMTLSESDDLAWESELDSRHPHWQATLFRVRPTRFARYVAVPLAFAVAAGFVPLRPVPSEENAPDAVARKTTARLEQMVDWLDEAHVLTAEESEELREEVAKLAEDSDSLLTHEKWEAIDTMKRELAQKLEAAQRSVAKGQLAARSLSREAGAEAEQLSLERVEQLEKDTLETLQNLADRGAVADTPQALQQELQRLLKERQLPKPLSSAAGQQREELLSELDEFLREQSAKLAECRGKCVGARLVEGEFAEGDGEGMLEAFLLAEGNSSANSQQPGRGGVTRGRGDAPLTWGQESDERKAKFKQVVLPPGFEDPESAAVVGESVVAPEAQPAETADRSSTRTFDPATGRESRRQALRPRHREVVRQYFTDDE
jgi:hypothetical protein